MAITYNNPNEVVKVKHILSLAEHIAEKIDGSSGGSTSSTTSKATPTLSASQTQWSAAIFSDDGEGGKISDTPTTLTYSGDGDFFIETAALLSKAVFSKVRRNGDKVAVQPYYMAAAAPTFPVTFKVGFTATDNYKACSVELTITA